MMHNGDSAETVAANIGKYSQSSPEQLEAVPTFGKEEYDAAYACQIRKRAWKTIAHDRNECYPQPEISVIDRCAESKSNKICIQLCRSGCEAKYQSKSRCVQMGTDSKRQSA